MMQNDDTYSEPCDVLFVGATLESLHVACRLQENTLKVRPVVFQTLSPFFFVLEALPGRLTGMTSKQSWFKQNDPAITVSAAAAEIHCCRP